MANSRWQKKKNSPDWIQLASITPVRKGVKRKE
jgi:hypothetical protein